MEQFLTLTHRHRLQVLQLLKVQRSLTVENVMSYLHLDEQAARRALGELHECGLILMSEIKGRYIYGYSDECIKGFIKALQKLI